jgi:cyanate permease
MLGVGYSVAAASPFALGAVRDATGSFSDALWVLVGAAAAFSLVVATLSRERLDAQRGIRSRSLRRAPTGT